MKILPLYCKRIVGKFLNKSDSFNDLSTFLNTRQYKLLYPYPAESMKNINNKIRLKVRLEFFCD